MWKFAVALVVTIMVIGAAVVYTQSGSRSQPGASLSPEDRYGVQGIHHRVARDLGPIDGRDLVIDDVVVGTDLIDVRYHATGTQMIKFQQINDNPVFAREGPTLTRAIADGKSLLRYEGNEQSELGSSAVRGNMVFRWQGEAVHHLQISIVRIMGDEHATWTTSFDF